LAYSYSTNGIPLTPGKPWLLNLLDEALIISDIQAAKALEPDFIVILPHMGVEYAVTPNAASRRIVRIMFEAGADFVFASHPHVLQPMEFIEITDGDGTLRNCFVHYSLGNFISSQRTLPREQSIILNLYFEKTEGEKASLRSASYIPTWVKFRDAGGRQNIKVLPVHDTVSAMDRGLDVDLRPHDRAHVRTVLRSITAMYGGQLCVCEEHASEYFIATPYGRLPCLDVLFDAATTPLS
jgi:poly-gamma-glutamate synthesis protein (capsule biosynthesis protein)